MKNILFQYNGIEYITLNDIMYRSESLIPTSYLGTEELHGLMLTVDKYAEILNVVNKGSIAYPNLQVTAIIEGKKYIANTWDKVAMFSEVKEEKAFEECMHPPIVEEAEKDNESAWMHDLESTADVESEERANEPLQIPESTVPRWMADLSKTSEVHADIESPISEQPEETAVVEETEVEETATEVEEPIEEIPESTTNPLFLRHIDAYSLEPINLDDVKNDAYCKEHGWYEMDSVWLIDDVVSAQRLIHSDSLNIHEAISYSEVARYNAKH